MFDVWEMAYVVIGSPQKHQVLEHQQRNNQLLKHQQKQILEVDVLEVDQIGQPCCNLIR
jgi:hypothetical protein